MEMTDRLLGTVFLRTRNRARKSTALLCLLLPGLWSSAAQSPQVFRTTVRTVQLDIVVTDQVGRPVRGLTQKDFTVLEDGEQQSIRTFEPPAAAIRQVNGEELAPGARVEARAAAERGEGPRTILLFDELNNNFTDIAYARSSLESFLKQQPETETPTALMVITPKRLKLVQSFTRSTPALLIALKSVPPELPTRGDGAISTSLATENEGKSLGALEQIARSAVGYSGRTNVIWLTGGFPALVATVNPQRQGDEARTATKALAQTHRLSALLMQSRFSLYTVDPLGVLQQGNVQGTPSTRGPGDPGPDGYSSQALLENGLSPEINADFQMASLTDSTGGRTYFNQNDVDKAIRRAVDDGDSAYSLSYDPSNKNFNGEYRAIKVKLDMPGLKARTREGYYAVAEPAALSPKQIQGRLERALESPLPYDGVKLEEQSVEYNAGDRRFVAHLAISPEGLSFHDRSTKQVVVLESVSAKGAITSHISWNIDWRYPGPKGTAILPVESVLPPGTESVHVLVASSDAQRIGTVALRVPRSALTESGGVSSVSMRK